MTGKRANIESEVVKYSRDSFDRFGDDLSELILSYLTFKDKIRFECTAKQWRTLIFRSQTSLVVKDIDDINCVKNIANNDEIHSINCHRLKTLLKKCRNIRVIDFGTSTLTASVLDIICEYCPRLFSISLSTFAVCVHEIIRFGHKFGQQLKTLHFTDTDLTKQRYLLKHCPNVEDLSCDHFWIGGLQEIKPLMKLKTLKVECHSMYNRFFDDINLLGPNLKSLELSTRWNRNLYLGLSLQPHTKTLLSLESLKTFGFKPSPQFFLYLAVITPNLTKLNVTGNFRPSDITLLNIANMPKLTELELRSNSINCDITEHGILKLVCKCKCLSLIRLRYKLYITKELIAELIRIANQRKDSITFQCFENINDDKELDSYDIPDNLKIKFSKFL